MKALRELAFDAARDKLLIVAIEIWKWLLGKQDVISSDGGGQFYDKDPVIATIVLLASAKMDHNSLIWSY